MKRIAAGAFAALCLMVGCTSDDRPTTVPQLKGMATYREVTGMGDDAYLFRVDDPANPEVSSVFLFVRYGELVIVSGTPPGERRCGAGSADPSVTCVVGWTGTTG